MRNQSEILKLPILSIQDGSSIGAVGRIVVNPVSRKAEYLALSGAAWFETPTLLPYAKVKSVGRDLITVRSAKDLVAVTEELKRTLAPLVEVVGVSVIDSCGEVVGTVADIALDTADGSLKQLILTDGTTMDADKIVTLSAAAVVTDANGVQDASEEDPEVQFFLGKTLSEDIVDEQGTVLLSAGVVVTHKEIEIARSHNALYELITAVK